MQTKPEVKNQKPRYKTLLSLGTVAIVILIVILLPKKQDTTRVEPPRTNVRYIPAPTPTPVETFMMIDPSRELPEVILPRDLQ
ncbi:hypothetical protein A2803_05925 [Candidatus Woesebacteria bacterium RIFCSPHIGHO2_01_FULL_44_21]|uniref:Uncharacterized protein n=1 Tax=Candidatus Woesebacteria bacterium RIFCSPHIGHO2_01_FULL_44_21 TaxID=1802503 RepID=A0A1F7Z070_9BACT|nr:MAG: hypothetical protein A2803_05925 [Candidatus Woesebacteria bacterium RIFCSPHIGHO2_01_FULL_44_21]OGM71081.1 MAG: hypothetical protein A2897_02500 [Candidatus Woesebacteria bacterium RIFCSPLOWO2_01_FULL_44_24b]